MNENSGRIDHILTREPIYLNTTQTVFSYGFIKMASIIWSPVIIFIIAIILFKKFYKK